MGTLSLDMRKEILAACDHGGATRAQVAHHYRVSLGLVKKLLQQRRRTGDIAPRHRYSGRKPLIKQSHQRHLRALLLQQPDLTLEELRATAGLSCTLPAIHRALKQMGLTYNERLLAPGNKVILKFRGRAAAAGIGRLVPAGFRGRSGKQNEYKAGARPGSAWRTYVRRISPRHPANNHNDGRPLQMEIPTE
jgi:transposase